jgi:2-oxoglutarate ferredoxin oxidoreductase subunit delta
MFLKGRVEINTEWCKGCELCISACPSGVLEMSKEINGKGVRYPVVKHAGKCTGCTLCAVVCPEIVITVYKKKKII